MADASADTDKSCIKKLLGELLASFDKATPHLQSVVSTCRAIGGISLKDEQNGEDLAQARLYAQAALSLSNIQTAKVMLSVPFDKEAFDELATERAHFKKLLAQIDAAESKSTGMQTTAARKVTVDQEASKRVLRGALWQPSRNKGRK